MLVVQWQYSAGGVYSQDANELVLDDNEDQDLDKRGGATSSDGGNELDQTGVVLALATSAEGIGVDLGF